MDRRRRKLMQSGGGVTLLSLLAAAGWLNPNTVRAQTWNSIAFDTHSVADALKGLGVGESTRSKDIVFFQTPEIAENGAVVPVGVTSNIAKTESIAILVEKNPNVLAAVFDIPAGTEPAIVTRVKMAQSANIYALVRADGRYYVATKEVKVTLGGCGG
jgi:sulfur-oxidizing protein SoxY